MSSRKPIKPLRISKKHTQEDSSQSNAQECDERDFNDLTREEIIALVKKVAEELGHRPNQYEFWQMAGAKKEHMRRLFGSYRELVQEAGFEATGPGYYITTDQLMTDWAVVARAGWAKRRPSCSMTRRASTAIEHSGCGGVRGTTCQER